MLPYPNINPVLIAFGPLQIRWYGIMYLLGFLFSYLLVRYQLARQKSKLLTKEQLLDLILLFNPGIDPWGQVGIYPFL